MATYIYDKFLGKQKLCTACNEYYPYTQEYFYRTSRKTKDDNFMLEKLCKACYKQKYRPYQKRIYDVSHKYM